MSPLDPIPGQQARERSMVIPTVVVVDVGRAAEVGGQDHQRITQQLLGLAGLPAGRSSLGPAPRPDVESLEVVAVGVSDALGKLDEPPIHLPLRLPTPDPSPDHQTRDPLFISFGLLVAAVVPQRGLGVGVPGELLDAQCIGPRVQQVRDERTSQVVR